MYLSELLHAYPSDELVALKSLHLGPSTGESAEISNLESVLKSYLTVKSTIHRCGPLAFFILQHLVTHKLNRTTVVELTASTLEELTRTLAGMNHGTVLRKNDRNELYCKVLFEARKSDLRIDPSEDSILALLRHELNISISDHYLSELRPEFAQFWGNPMEAFAAAFEHLRIAGLIFKLDDDVVVPQDLVDAIKSCIGAELSRANHIRLLEQLTLQDLAIATSFGLRLEGSKNDRIQIIVDNFVSPRTHLLELSGESLRDLCTAFGTKGYGTKDQIIEKLLNALVNGADPAEASPELEAIELRELQEDRFKYLFSLVKANHISSLLESIERARRTTGSKRQLIEYLWELQISERTYLQKFKNDQLDMMMAKLELKTGGSKADKIEKLLSHLKSASFDTLSLQAPEQDSENVPDDKRASGQ